MQYKPFDNDICSAINKPGIHPKPVDYRLEKNKTWKLGGFNIILLNIQYAKDKIDLIDIFLQLECPNVVFLFSKNK